MTPAWNIASSSWRFARPGAARRQTPYTKLHTMPIDDPALTRKKCAMCDETRIAKFYAKKTTKSGNKRYYSYCVECCRVKAREYRAANHEKVKAQQRASFHNNPEGMWDSALKYKYNITADQYRAMHEAQGGLCAICHRAPTDAKRLAVDHDHGCCSGNRSCGKCVRALLCHRCNQGLGQFGDDPARLRRAAEYLARP